MEDKNRPIPIESSGLPRVVVIGGGFAGIEFVKKLDTGNYEVIMLDRHNYHTFQPLLYQVATAGLEPDSIAQPLRKVFASKKNYHFRVATVERVEAQANRVHTDIGWIQYDILVVAVGTRTNYFGNDALRLGTLPMKQVPHALDMRSHILQAFESALLETDPAVRQALMNFVIVGGGPTGVELAGALSELKNHILPEDYPELDLKQMRITLVDGSPKLLGTMSEYASRRAEKDLRHFGVEIILNNVVSTVEGDKVTLKDGTIIMAHNVFWAAGVTGNLVDGFDSSIITRANRLMVDEHNLVKGTNNVYALGDIASMTAEKDYPNGHPQLAPVAIQQGKHLGTNLNRLARNQSLLSFKYFNKGSMATIGRNHAVVDLPWPKWSFGGFVAWLAWMFVHLLYLVGFRNKVITIFNWLYSYITFDRSTRLIVRPYVKPRVQQPPLAESEVIANEEPAKV